VRVCKLLRYVVRILTHCYEQNRKKLPPAGAPRPGCLEALLRIADLFGTVPAQLSSYLPSFVMGWSIWHRWKTQLCRPKYASGLS